MAVGFFFAGFVAGAGARESPKCAAILSAVAEPIPPPRRKRETTGCDVPHSSATAKAVLPLALITSLSWSLMVMRKGYRSVVEL